MSTSTSVTYKLSAMSQAAETPRSRAASFLSTSASTEAATSKELSVVASEQPIEFLDEEHLQASGFELSGVFIDTPENFDRDSYSVLEGESDVRKVLREQNIENGIAYQVRFGDNRTEVVSLIPSIPLPVHEMPFVQ
jgi:hypothetical protein